VRSSMAIALQQTGGGGVWIIRHLTWINAADLCARTLERGLGFSGSVVVNRPNMKRTLRVLGRVATLLGGVGSAFAESEATALVDQQRCMFCHTIDTPFRAPSFQHIAACQMPVPC